MPQSRQSEPGSNHGEVVREHQVYYATLAEQAERYEDMAEHMYNAARMDDELDKEERNLLAVAYKQAVGHRRSAWRIISNAEMREEQLGNDDNAACARNYRKKVEAEMKTLCHTVLALLTDHLIPRARSAEAKVSYHKAQGDYYRYIAEISDDVDKTRAMQSAKNAYEDGTKVAERDLKVTNPLRLGLALNHAVFYYEILRSPTDASRIARKALEDASREIENVEIEEAKESALTMQLLRDNLTSWTADEYD